MLFREVLRLCASRYDDAPQVFVRRSVNGVDNAHIELQFRALSRSSLRVVGYVTQPEKIAMVYSMSTTRPIAES